ncbi:FxsA family protein [Virgibacillus xinjiangensis]|uniref:FxsA family protein n=1 Tax=Virgibacillus xinjiangensis TaxID=393090 RepID=A0ABV7CV20_9BACI
MRYLAILLLIISALEIGVFLWIGGLVGPWWVVLLIILTGILGMALAKKQGADVWDKARLAMNNGQAPTEYLIDGICIFTGAIFLLTPGFITDILGFLLVIPFTRGLFRSKIRNYLRSRMGKGTIIYRKW